MTTFQSQNCNKIRDLGRRSAPLDLFVLEVDSSHKFRKYFRSDALHFTTFKQVISGEKLWWKVSNLHKLFPKEEFKESKARSSCYGDPSSNVVENGATEFYLRNADTLCQRVLFKRMIR